MSTRSTRISAAVLIAVAFSASANAEFRCASAQNWPDRAACEAADQSPEALRRFVENMNTLRINLRFADYVDLKTAQRWEEKSRQLAEQKKNAEDTQKVASSAQR
jgi:hypothetical protein